MWQYEGGAGSWYFITVPKRVSAEIQQQSAGRSKAWGSLRVTAIIGATRWKTSLFRDRKRDAYLLPLKAPVRVKEQLCAGEVAEVTIITA